MSPALFIIFVGGLFAVSAFKNIPIKNLLAGDTTPRESAFASSVNSAANSISTGISSALGQGIINKNNLGRTDQGVDFTGKGKVPAVDSGEIVSVNRRSGWPGGTLIVQKIDNPPDSRHQFVYYAENIAPQVHKGDKVSAGEPIGQAAGVYPFTELGWSDANGVPLAHASYKEGVATDEGKHFLKWLGF